MFEADGIENCLHNDQLGTENCLHTTMTRKRREQKKNNVHVDDGDALNR